MHANRPPTLSLNYGRQRRPRQPRSLHVGPQEPLRGEADGLESLVGPLGYVLGGVALLLARDHRW